LETSYIVYGADFEEIVHFSGVIALLIEPHRLGESCTHIGGSLGALHHTFDVGHVTLKISCLTFGAIFEGLPPFKGFVHDFDDVFTLEAHISTLEET
jgi:hypothetical protein